MKKPGVKAKGKRALTNAEQQQRFRGRMRIINEELAKGGLKPMPVYMPPIYLQAMRAFESNFHSEQNMVKTVIHSSNWICKLVEEFIEQQSEIFPNSEFAKLYNSPEWVSRDSLHFDIIALNAQHAICEFEDQHQQGIN
jgi:hypothetical protein